MHLKKVGFKDRTSLEILLIKIFRIKKNKSLRKAYNKTKTFSKVWNLIFSPRNQFSFTKAKTTFV